jgi:uncharacterized lipoprotein
VRTAKSLAFLLVAALVLPACSGGSKLSRAERDYAKYVRKSSAARQQQRAKVQRSQQEIPSEAERTEVTTSTEEAPSDG